MARTWFRIAADGSVSAPSEVWAWVSSKVAQMARRDLANGHEISRLLELAQVAAEAAEIQTAPDDTSVSLAKPANPAIVRLEEISPKEAAMRMNCSEQYVRRLCSQGRINARRLGLIWLIDAADIDRSTPRSSK